MQIEAIQNIGYDYITCLTKKEITTFDKQNQIQLFDNDLCEIVTNGIRYIYRLNPFRKEEIQKTRKQFITLVQEKISKSNIYLSEHPKAKTPTQETKIVELIKKHHLDTFCNILLDGRNIELNINTEAMFEYSKYDGV